MTEMSILFSRRTRLAITVAPLAGVAIAAASAATTSTLGAQLRPLDPLDWPAMHADVVVSGMIGGGRFADQRLGVAGTMGRLTELGNVGLAWHTGRVLLDVGGTMQRVFHDEAVFRGPLPDVRGPSGPGRTRRDAGDYRVFTTVRLTPTTLPVQVAARFGTRLPTTDNQVGMDRDATDFYALLDAAVEHRRFSAALEVGVGLLGTRYQDYEQADVTQYAGTVAYSVGPVTPSLTLVGQATTATFQAPGTENLAELRPAVQVGTRRWVRVTYVDGHARFSPSHGVLVNVGMRR
jgi:hypothetical protein